MSDYRQSEGISQSELKIFAANPELYKLMYIDKVLPWPKPSKVMILGSKVEAYIRGASDEGKVVRVPDSVLTKNGQKRGNAFDAWKLEACPDTDAAYVLTDKQYDDEYQMYARIKENIEQHQAARYLLLSDAGSWHTSFHWDCPTTGLLRKGETDRWFSRESMEIDLKCVRDPTPRAFAKQIEELGYHVQHANYREGIERTKPDNWSGDPVQCGFVCIRNTEPFDVHVYELSTEWVDSGTAWTIRTMTKLKKAMDSNDWQFAGHGEVGQLERPAWAQKQADSDERAFTFEQDEERVY